MPRRRDVWRIDRAGSLDRVTRRTEDLPDPAAGHARVAVKAVGLNFADIFACLGLYSATPSGSSIPGLEFAGIVEALGPASSDTELRAVGVGDRVVGVTRFGGYATAIDTDLRYVRPIRAGWSFAEAAAFPVQGLTAWYGLVRSARSSAEASSCCSRPPAVSAFGARAARSHWRWYHRDGRARVQTPMVDRAPRPGTGPGDRARSGHVRRGSGPRARRLAPAASTWSSMPLPDRSSSQPTIACSRRGDRRLAGRTVRQRHRRPGRSRGRQGRRARGTIHAERADRAQSPGPVPGRGARSTIGVWTRARPSRWYQERQWLRAARAPEGRHRRRPSNRTTLRARPRQRPYHAVSPGKAAASAKLPPRAYRSDVAQVGVDCRGVSTEAPSLPRRDQADADGARLLY